VRLVCLLERVKKKSKRERKLACAGDSSSEHGATLVYIGEILESHNNVVVVLEFFLFLLLPHC
jgi:hypothetical protein